jgi:hypothetical protein
MQAMIGGQGIQPRGPSMGPFPQQQPQNMAQNFPQMQPQAMPGRDQTQGMGEGTTQYNAPMGGMSGGNMAGSLGQMQQGMQGSLGDASNMMRTGNYTGPMGANGRPMQAPGTRQDMGGGVTQFTPQGGWGQQQQFSPQMLQARMGGNQMGMPPGQSIPGMQAPAKQGSQFSANGAATANGWNPPSTTYQGNTL